MEKPPPPPWPVHPEAEKLPMMGDVEIEELRADVFENGLREPIHIWFDNHAAASGSKGPFPYFLIDGRNRMEALRREGHSSPLEVNTKGICYHYAIKWERKRQGWVVDCDPVKFILSMNVHRRHLSPEQRREAIAAYIKADPQASNREVSRALKVDHKTVGAVRAEEEGAKWGNSPNCLPSTEGKSRGGPGRKPGAFHRRACGENRRV